MALQALRFAFAKPAYMDSFVGLGPPQFEQNLP